MKPWFLTAALLVLIACEQKVVEPKDEATTASPTGRISQFGLYRLVRSGGLVDNPHNQYRQDGF